MQQITWDSPSVSADQRGKPFYRAQPLRMPFYGCLCFKVSKLRCSHRESRALSFTNRPLWLALSPSCSHFEIAICGDLDQSKFTAICEPDLSCRHRPQAGAAATWALHMHKQDVTSIGSWPLNLSAWGWPTS